MFVGIIGIVARFLSRYVVGVVVVCVGTWVGCAERRV